MLTMKLIDEIRLDNLKALAVEFGTQAAVADLIGISSSQLSQWMTASENSGTGKPRVISTASCRRVETACGKPVGWMDTAHEATDAQAPAVGAQQYQWVSAEESQLLSDYRRKSDDDKQTIRDLVRTLKNAI